MKDLEHIRPIYSIGTAKSLTGLTSRQIRYYEEKEIVRPFRTAGNQRIFSKQDIEILHITKELLKEGNTLEGIKAHLKNLYPSYYEKKKVNDLEARQVRLEQLTNKGQKNLLNSFYEINRKERN